MLSVRHLALVDQLQLDLEPGLNVLTGETGAGKSILINALSLVLGGRASADIVQQGADQAVVEALFVVHPEGELAGRLEAAGISVPDGELLVRRTVGGGRGRVHLNGQLATVAMLQDVLRGVVDITSQHEHVSLLESERHLDLLDRWGEHLQLRAKVEQAHAAVARLQAERRDIDADESVRAQREDYLRFAIDELRQLDPSSGELEELEREREILKHRDRILSARAEAEALLYGDEGSSVETMGAALRALTAVSEHDPQSRAWAGWMERSIAEMEELVRELRSGLEAPDDPGRLDEVEERVHALRKVARKHGGTIEGALQALQAMERELETMEGRDARRDALQAELTEAARVHQEVAKALSGARARSARRFAAALERELQELGMGGTRLAFALRPLDEPGPRGAESVELMASTNPGEPERPLRRVASGGELSRLLLAIKQVQAERGGIQTFVFDEVDTGIGGKVADVLGEKLREVAERGQVLCVTHLAQVAAHAETHFVVEKSTTNKRTRSSVRRLAPEGRVDELARMLGSTTAKGVSLAEELMAGAARRRAGARPDPRRGAR